MSQETVLKTLERTLPFLHRGIPDGLGGTSIHIYSRLRWKDISRAVRSESEQHLERYDSIFIFPGFVRTEGSPSVFYPGAVSQLDSEKFSGSEMEFAVPYSWLSTMIEVANSPDSADAVRGRGNRLIYRQNMLNAIKYLRDQTSSWKDMDLFLLGQAAANLAPSLGLNDERDNADPVIRTERLRLKEFPYFPAIGIQLPDGVNVTQVNRPVALLTGFLDSGMEVAAAITALKFHGLASDSISSYSVAAPNAAAYWLSRFRSDQLTDGQCINGNDIAVFAGGYIGHDGYARLSSTDTEPLLQMYPDVGQHHDLIGGNAVLFTQVDPLT